MPPTTASPPIASIGDSKGSQVKPRTLDEWFQAICLAILTFGTLGILADHTSVLVSHLAR